MLKVFETVAEDGVIRLPGDVSASAHCLVTVLEDDLDTLGEQSQLELSEAKQRRMSDLLRKNREGILSATEQKELDVLSAEFDAATLSKGRALAALAHLNGNSQHE